MDSFRRESSGCFLQGADAHPATTARVSAMGRHATAAEFRGRTFTTNSRKALLLAEAAKKISAGKS
jgi:hypothetical protein